MSKDLSVGVLMDFYSDLLTEKQRDTLDLYYNKDYSLAEIAEDLEISRQGVRDFIKRGEKQLHDFEETLKMAERFKKITKEVNEIEALVNETNSLNVDEKKVNITRKLKKIKEALQ
ncbi:MAG: sigma factor-like helix-turn-helix DNA-binding protein [Clostridia bacterium]|nr:sigma factor-like helix-turn-helix DNA-binding protein [Clostridia bacterium]